MDGSGPTDLTMPGVAMGLMVVVAAGRGDKQELEVVTEITTGRDQQLGLLTEDIMTR